jgi:polysaccharide deacetylase family protein (PEP-CTERM system associated)
MAASLPHAFTVDLEEWFQGLTSTNRQPSRWSEFESRVEAATDRLLALLAEHHVLATFFVLGHVADHHPALIERIAAAGHELAIHGYWHRFVSKMTPQEFDEEITASLAALRRITGEQPLGHRAPYFSVNAATPWAFDVLADHGLRYDASVFPLRNMLYGFAGAPRLPYRTAGDRLWELPAATVEWGGRRWPMAGGFYVRALPYALVRWAVARMQAADEPAILYVHPWELDTGQRYDRVTPRERITHYYGRGGLAAKLHRLLQEFRFGRMADLVTALERKEAATPAGVAP